jgi:hypothetical protein
VNGLPLVPLPVMVTLAPLLVSSGSTGAVIFRSM